MKFGLFTCGGWSIVAQMQKLYVEQEKVITSGRAAGFNQRRPQACRGTMIGNVAMLYGYRVAGVAGGMACLFGMILPPLAVLAVITQFTRRSRITSGWRRRCAASARWLCRL